MDTLPETPPVIGQVAQKQNQKRKVWIWIVVILAVAFLWFGMPRRSGKPFTLPSGKQIKISSIVPMHFPNGSDAMIMNCETEIAIDDKANLRKEIDEIWDILQKKVEAANMTNGVIRITHTEGSGLVTHSKGFGFVFEKRADGLWHCLQDEKQ